MTLAAAVVLPLTYFSFEGAASAGPGALVKPSAILAQMLSSGTATAGQRYLVSSASQAATLFGAGSVAHRMARAFLANHPTGELYVIPLADASGTAASQTITVTGPASGAGTIFLRVAGELLEVPVAVSDSATDIGDAIEAAINANTALPVTALNSAGTVTVTCKHDGTVGNGVTLSLNDLGSPDEVLPAGVGCTLGGATLASGATDPTAGDWITAMGDDAYDVVVLQYTASAFLGAVKTEMERRWGPTVQLQGTAFACHFADPGAGVTFVEGRNDKHLSCRILDNAKSWLSMPGEYAAAYAGIAALYLGADPGRPLQTLPEAGVYVGTSESFTDRNTLANAGAATTSVTAGTSYIEAETLTYRTSALGADDRSWEYVQVPFLLQRLGRRLKSRIESRYPRHKLADDGNRFGPSVAVVTPGTLKGEIVAECLAMESEGFLENVAEWKGSIVCERDTVNRNRVNVTIPADLINQFRVGSFTVAFGG